MQCRKLEPYSHADIHGEGLSTIEGTITYQDRICLENNYISME